MLTKDFDYNLPEALIAQVPPAVRGTSRMMVVDRATTGVEHRIISDIVDYLNPGDLLILNNTKVFPARAMGSWADTGGAAEILLLDNCEAESTLPNGTYTSLWRCMCGTGRKQRINHTINFGNGALMGTILDKDVEGNSHIRFESQRPLLTLLNEFGKTPVPPYIHREDASPEIARLDKERYQTIFAEKTGAVAAPTAGLHFTEAIFHALAAKGVKRAFITLHVGPGTFKPVKAEAIEEHRMDAEYYEITEETAEAIAACRARGNRVVAVGSTSVRTLETVAGLNDGKIVATHGKSQIFIYPPYTFKVVDAMLTNFHLPQSTLIMMVSALAGQVRIMDAYKEAIAQSYRFFSYGDCMLII